MEKWFADCQALCQCCINRLTDAVLRAPTRASDEEQPSKDIKEDADPELRPPPTEQALGVTPEPATRAQDHPRQDSGSRRAQALLPHSLVSNPSSATYQLCDLGD